MIALEPIQQVRERLVAAAKSYEVDMVGFLRDLISIPPGVYRGEINIGEEDCLMCVMLGAPKPITPTYPPDHPLAKIKR